MKANVERHVRKTFPENPDAAVAVVRCESRFDQSAVSHTDDHGIFQVHAPVWNKKARELGYADYKTDVQDNVAMARYIYEQAGYRFDDWVCADILGIT